MESDKQIAGIRQLQQLAGAGCVHPQGSTHTLLMLHMGSCLMLLGRLLAPGSCPECAPLRAEAVLIGIYKLMLVMQALCQLFKAHLLMADDIRQGQPALQALDACQAILQHHEAQLHLEQQQQQQQQQHGAPCGATMASSISAQLSLHQALLRCLLLLSQGCIASLAATASITLAGELALATTSLCCL